MFFNYGYKISKIFKEAEKERYNLFHPYVGSEHLLLSILKNDKECMEIFKKFDVFYDNFKEALVDVVGSASKKQEINLYTPLLKRIIANATDMALEEKREVTCKDLILSLLEESEGIAFRLLISLDVDPDILYKSLKSKLNKDELIKVDIGINLNKTVDMDEQIIGREKEIDEVIEILLRKKKNNPILIGKAGVGKTALVEQLARMINNKNVPLDLQNSQIIAIEMGSLVAGTKYRGEFEERLTKIINEISQKEKIILFIDEVHTIANAGGSEGAISASDILKPYMARGDIKIIGATTEEEYEKHILKDKALARRFDKVMIGEPNKKEMLDLMLKVKKEYEDFHNVSINDDVIKYLVNKSDEYINNKNNPDKTIELLDTICSHVKLKRKNNHSGEELTDLKNKCLKEKDYQKASYYLKEQLKLSSIKYNEKIVINKTDVLEVITSKNKMPTLKDFDLLNEKIKTLNIFNYEKLIETIKDKYINVNVNKSVLLIGNYKSLLNYLIDYYNPRLKPIIIDCKEYTNQSKLLGTSAGYIGYNDSYPLKSIINYPYSLVIFKNIDKTSKDIQSIITKIVKEGVITSGKGDELDFTKALVIGTKEKEKTNMVGFNRDNIVNNTFDFNEVIEIEKNNLTSV